MSDEVEAKPAHRRPVGLLRAVLGPPRPMVAKWSTVGNFTVWKLRALSHPSQWRWWVGNGLVVLSGATGIRDHDLSVVAVFVRSLGVAVLAFYLPFVLDGFRLAFREWRHGRTRSDRRP